MKPAAATIDAFLATLSPDKRATLETLRRQIHAAAPGCEECMSYGVPGVRIGGRLLVSFGAGAKHCAMYPGAQPIAALASELEGYDVSKGTIRFPVDRPLPAGLVKKIVKLRLAEAAAKAKPRRR